MSSDDDSEKSHEPTQKKLDDARKKGEIARSTDISTAASYGGLLLALGIAGASSMSQLGNGLSVLIDQSVTLAPLMFEGSQSAATAGIFLKVGRALLPIFLLPGLVVLLTILAQRGLVFAPSKLELKLSRISPISNAKNKFGRGGLFEFAKSFAKLLIFSVCLALFLSARFEEMVVTMQSGPLIAMAALGRLSIAFLFIVLVVALAIGALDMLWQISEHRRKNMMSNKDLRDEHKESEGDPYMKQQRRMRGQEIAMNRMLVDVPTADVIVVNPTHYAVALKWSRAKGEAPVCVAKGVDEMAMTIRKIAQENNVPLHSDPPTARALFATTEIGAQIAPDHYRAVAAAIRFAEAMRKKAAEMR